jgi:CDGSH-type Zn-finger protein
MGIGMDDKTKMRKEPYVIVMEPGTYYWCTCGQTKTPPYCDDHHKGTTFKPVKAVIKTEGPVVWCGCHESHDPPFCDGTHKVK